MNNSNTHYITPSPSRNSDESKQEEDISTNWQDNSTNGHIRNNELIYFYGDYPVTFTTDENSLPSRNLAIMAPHSFGHISEHSRWEYSIPDGLFVLLQDLDKTDDEFKRILSLIPDYVYEMIDDNL